MSGREARAEAALHAAGFPGATVSADGHDGDVAAVRLPAGSWEALLGEPGREAVAAVKALGFRFVALDLDPLDPS